MTPWIVLVGATLFTAFFVWFAVVMIVNALRYGRQYGWKTPGFPLFRFDDEFSKPRNRSKTGRSRPPNEQP